jgi:hypothetical protein
VRTTWNFDEEVVQEVKRYARERSIPAGEAASRLIRRALKTGVGIRYENGFPVFDVPPDTPVVTKEHVQQLIDELT